MKMISWLNMYLYEEDTKILILLSMILLANMLDFVIGWVNAKFNEKVEFSSGIAIYGIARKLVLFILTVLFVPFSMLMPEVIGTGALYTFLIGYFITEVNSILSHLRLAKDAKDTDLFADFLSRITGRNSHND